MQGAMRTGLAGVTGVVVAFVTVAVVEAIGHAVYPPPPNLDFSNEAMVREFVAGLPLGALLFVLGAWIAATIAGSAVAGLISRSRAMRLALLVGGFLFAATVANLLLIPHPMWFGVVAVVGIPLAAWLTGRTLQAA